MINRLAKATALVCIAVFSIQSLTAQNTKDFGGWYVGNFLYKADSTWNFFFETQTRSQKVGDIFFYHEFKGGFSYNILKKHSVLFGFGDYKTYSSTGNYKAPMLAKEFRMWEQLTVNNNIGRLKIDHRYRIEQRWLNGEYRNRFRYRINPLIPVNHKTIVDNTFFVSLFEEVFFTNTAPYFERNRFFAGAGYQFNSLVTTQLGWIRQYDYRKIDDGTGKSFLQLTMFFIVDHSNNARERHPGTLD